MVFSNRETISDSDTPSVAWFDNYKYLGADVELWLIKGTNANVSASFGLHLTDFKKGPDSNGIDTTLIVSTRPVRNLEITGGFKVSFDNFPDTRKNITLIHLVPGIECRITKKLDFLAEFGVSLTNNSWSYLCFGLSYYFQQ